MKVTDYIAEFLHVQGVTHVFELSGGMITHILDSLYMAGNVKIVTMHHEQAAAFAADAYGRINGIPGVALATSGPGATNLLTGIASCYFDSVPAVFFTGQVNQSEQKGDSKVRQLGFQETDIVTMARPVTKAVFSVQDGQDIIRILNESFQLAVSGRPGPVLIDLPMNIQRQDIKVSLPISAESKMANSAELNHSIFEGLFNSLKNSNSPLILAGRGSLGDQSRDALIKFAELFQVPVITSLLAVEAIPFDHPLRVGFIGSYGNRWANIAISQSDLIVVIGSRLDIRQTGADVIGFKGNKDIYQIDIEDADINNRVKGCIPIISDAFNFLDKFLDFCTGKELKNNFSKWHNCIKSLRERWPDINENPGVDGINPNEFIHSLSKASANADSYIADVGSHQMWAAQSLELMAHQHFITSGGMGAMGYALPAAIGACIASGNKPVVMISGDGGFQLNIQELQTIVRNNLPVKLVIINNKSLGMIRQFQDSYFDSKYQSTMWGYSTPDFEKVAIAYGIDSITIEQNEHIEKALKSLWRDPSKPFLLQVMVNPKFNAYPKIAFGKPISEMEPHSLPLDMEGT